MKTSCFAILLLSATAAGAETQSTAAGAQAQAAAPSSGKTSCGLACVMDDSKPASSAAAGTKLPANLAKMAENKSDLNKVVCEKQETTGTRLGTKKVCMTVAQWIEFQNDVKDQMRRMEIQGITSK